MGVTNSYKSHAKEKASTQAKRAQRGNRGLLWLLACMVVVATGAALMVPAISMTKESAENEVAAVQVQAEEESQDEAGDAADTPKAGDSKASQDEKPAAEDQGEGSSDQGGESVGGGSDSADEAVNDKPATSGDASDKKWGASPRMLPTPKPTTPSARPSNSKTRCWTKTATCS